VRKLPLDLVREPAPSRSPLRRAAMAVALGLTFGPFIVEGTALCTARWKAMYGPVVTPRTPMLESASLGLQSICRTTQLASSQVFRNLPWRASCVIPMACLWAACGGLLLRRR
jgi:hypothetical protein